MIRTLAADHRPPWIRLLLSAVLLAALFAAAPTHTHATVGAEAACASCTLQHQSASLPTDPAAVPCPEGPGTELRPAQTPCVPVGFASPSQPRAPPFPS